MTMLRLAHYLAAIAGGSAALAQVTPPAPPQPATSLPIVMPSMSTPPAAQFVTWSTRDVRCGDSARSFARAPAVLPAQTWFVSASAKRTASYTFAIDADGRTTGIRRDGTAFVPDGSDLAPALAVATFAAGRPAASCSVTFDALIQPIAQAPVASVMAAIIFPTQRATPAMWARVKPAGSTCFDPGPAVRMRAYPPFDQIVKQPGRQSWSMVGFDIDAKGDPRNVTLVTGNGNAALDTASLKAVRESRFAPGQPRVGCNYPYWLAARPLPAPPIPEEDAFRSQTATCPRTSDWATPPRLIYPAAFGRRSVEGWAIVSYDVAPWGQIGNARVLRAEPAEEFGQQALMVINSARRAPSDRGYTGCIDRVRFVMPDPAPVNMDPGPKAY